MTKEFPLVSVITPFFNEEKFLEETIQSVLSQKYDHWELILVDDGSTDKSTDVAKHFANLHPDRIKYYDHPNHGNRGSSASRNLGIKNAKGELISFIDADDIFQPYYLENQIQVFNNTEAKMVCEATVYWNSWYDERNNDDIKLIGAPQNQLYKPKELNLTLYPLNKGAAAPCMCGIIILKETILKHDGFVDSFKRNYTDQVFLSKIYFNEPVYISSACNNLYRQRDDSMMAVIKDPADYIKIRTRFLEWFKSYLEDINATNNEVYKLVKNTLLPYKYPRYHKIVYVLPRRILNKIRDSFRY